MEEEIVPELSSFNPNRCMKTYSKIKNKDLALYKATKRVIKEQPQVLKNQPLTTKNAVKFLLDGTLKKKICRYCLNVTSPLSELDQILQVKGEGTLYKVTIRDMLASFHPFKVTEDSNFPNKICNKCLDRAIGSYLFTQQCEQSERALRNCFEDMFEKLEKLDPIDGPKKRGRQKLHPNFNTLYTEHKNVIGYAEPIINIVHTASESLNKEDGIKTFECLKCCQVLPNMESLLNHEKSHPKSMWYHCRLCGRSFPKRYQLKRHKNVHNKNPDIEKNEGKFSCNKCGETSKDHKEFIQHMEKHKFKVVMEHLVERKMDRLCLICLDRSSNMTNLDKTICLHGGYPELSGNRNLYNILGSTLPDMKTLHNYTGSKICEKCLNNSITSYIFKHQFNCSRNRLDTCLNLILDELKNITDPENKVFIEISQKVIMPIVQDVEELIAENNCIDDSKLKIDELEDVNRVKIDNEDSDSQEHKTNSIDNDSDSTSISNPAKDVTQTYSKNKLVNGYQSLTALEKVSEFLSFKEKKKIKKPAPKFTCPVCNKHFITESFLSNHISKHINRKVLCKICGNSFKSKFIMQQHMKMVHVLKKTSYHICVTCGRCFHDSKKFLFHEKIHFAKTCNLCGKTFRDQNYFDNHMQRHLLKLRIRQRKYIQTCSFCEKECFSENELSMHVNKVHLQIKPHSCDMCEAYFYTEFSLNNHKKIHSLHSRETCEFCNKTLKSRKMLVIHLRKHLGVTPYMCQICCTSFHSQSKMTSHLIAHHGGKHICRFCKIAFITKSKLKDHFTTVHSAI